MPKVKDVLRVDNWIKGHGAVDQAGNALNPRFASACKFCLAGAIYKCYEDEQTVLDDVAAFIRSHFKTDWVPRNSNAIGVIAGFNDYHARWADIETIIKECEL